MRANVLSAAFLCLAGVACSSDPAPGGGPGSGPPAGSAGSGGSATGGTGGRGGPAAGGSGGSAAGTGGGAAGGSGGGAGGSGGSTAGASGSGGSAGSGGAGGAGRSDGPARSDAGLPGARDAGSDAPPAGAPGGAGCTGVKAVFCEDFEAQTPGRAPAGMFTVRGAVVVDDTRPFSGKLSAHIKLNNPRPDTTAQMVFGRPFLPLPSNDLHGRAMVYMTAVPGCCSNSNDIHWDLTAAKAGNIEYVLGSMYGNFMPVYQPPDDSVDTDTRWPEKKWVCIQWEFKGSGNGLVDVKVDGVRAQPGIPVTKWKPGGPWTSLNFGWINFQPSSVPVDMWFDELAFGEQEIPCPAAPAP